jgi:hypothetical protein
VSRKGEELVIIEKLQERIGRLKAKSRGIGQHYQITVTTDTAWVSH